MNIKILEVRDRGTFIPVMAFDVSPSASPGAEAGEAEYYLMRRAGYNFDDPSIMLLRLEPRGYHTQCTYDPFDWQETNNRTLHVAHLHIATHWAEIQSGDVIDVEFILGETQFPKTSERLNV